MEHREYYKNRFIWFNRFKAGMKKTCEMITYQHDLVSHSLIALREVVKQLNLYSNMKKKCHSPLV